MYIELKQNLKFILIILISKVEYQNNKIKRTDITRLNKESVLSNIQGHAAANAVR